jgi:aspartyl-tRNA synthetase
MKFNYLTELTKGKNFPIFDAAETVLGICATGCANYTRKQLDELTAWVKRPQIGAKGLVYVFCQADGTFKSLKQVELLERGELEPLTLPICSTPLGAIPL